MGDDLTIEFQQCQNVAPSSTKTLSENWSLRTSYEFPTLLTLIGSQHPRYVRNVSNLAEIMSVFMLETFTCTLQEHSHALERKKEIFF